MTPPCLQKSVEFNRKQALPKGDFPCRSSDLKEFFLVKYNLYCVTRTVELHGVPFGNVRSY